MNVSFDMINGINVGIEYVQGDEDFENTIILDVFIVRLLFQWP